MIGYRSRVLSFCCEDIKLIENYDKAVNDTEVSYHCHHRLQTHYENGKERGAGNNLTIAYLIRNNLYYNRPASELIFLTPSEHSKMHGSRVIGMRWNLSIETREKISKAAIGNKNGIGNKSRLGQKQSKEEIEKRMAKVRGVKNPNKATCKGRSWYVTEEGKRKYV